MMPENYHRVVLWAAVALAGGAVRVCRNSKMTSLRVIVSSLMLAAFTGAVAGALLQHHISDPMLHGAIIAVTGYSGHAGLDLIIKLFQSKVNINIGGGNDGGI